MAQAPELARLAERRRLLLEQSAALRQRIVEDFESLKSWSTWIETGYALAQSWRKFWPLAATLAGLTLGRKKGGWMSRVGKLVSLWQLGRKVSRLFRSKETTRA